MDVLSKLNDFALADRDANYGIYYVKTTSCEWSEGTFKHLKSHTVTTRQHSVNKGSVSDNIVPT